MEEREKVTCGFCGRVEQDDDSNIFVAGITATICEECVRLAEDTLREKREEERFNDPDYVPPLLEPSRQELESTIYDLRLMVEIMTEILDKWRPIVHGKGQKNES